MSNALDVLVIEDDEGLNQLIQRRLSREGHTCHGFCRAEEALNWLETNTPDLMIVDLVLPDYSGDDLIDILKKKRSKVPFIIATGQGSEDVAVKMLKKGARDYLVKNSEFLNVLPTTIDNVWREIKLQHLLEKAQTQLREKNAVLSAVHQLSPDGIVVVGSERTVLSCNQRFVDIFSLEAPLLYQPERQLFETVAGKILDGDLFLETVLNVDADFAGLLLGRLQLGNLFYELYTMPMALEKADEAGRVWYFRDITAHVEAEEQKEQARLEAERNVNLRSQFFAVVSHDVKTPLNSIIGFLALLRNSELDDEQKRYLEIIKAASEHLFMLINDILDMTKIERGSFELNPTRTFLPDLLEECTSIFLPISRQSEIELTHDISEDVPPWLVTDAIRLKQIVINLLGNAMKFTREGSVALTVRKLNDQFLEFQVKDTGTGIPDGVQDVIFTPFTQANSDVYNKYGGSGLGLAITKQLVECFGGEIGLVSEVGMGSTFTFSLPIEYKADAETAKN